MNSADSPDPIHRCIENWHHQISGSLDGGFDAILHPDVTFLSPIVFTPQQGRDITKLYLSAATNTLGGGNLSDQDRAASKEDGTAFHYTKQILSGRHAMLEFETTVDGTSVNGVDIITCDDDSMITEFRVMVRPLKAINVVHEQMKAMLESFAAKHESETA